MNCPICGKELPEKARKCDKCGCRPKYLYGRPSLPKWVIPTALALVVTILAGCLLVPRLLKKGDYELWQLVATDHVVMETSYSYDEQGNLEEARYAVIPSFEGYSSMTVEYRVKFFYDENGIFTAVKIFVSESDQPFKVGTVEYDEKANTVTVRYSAEETIGASKTLFQYDESGRLKEFTWGASYRQKIQLAYDADGRVESYKTLNQSSGQAWNEYSLEKMKYAENELIGYTTKYTSAWDTFENICESDQWGNVVSAGTEGIVDITYEYECRVVSAQTARQYELQMYLMHSLGMSPYGIVFPVVKTPC